MTPETATVQLRIQARVLRQTDFECSDDEAFALYMVATFAGNTDPQKTDAPHVAHFRAAVRGFIAEAAKFKAANDRAHAEEAAKLK